MRAHLTLVLALAVACSGERETAPADAGTQSGPVPACVDGKPTRAWPEGPYALDIGSVVPPDLAFGDVTLTEYYEPCSARARLLLLRASAAWCGTCIWHATHRQRLFDAFGGRISLVDVLVADEDNMPPTPSALARWRERDPSVRTAMDAQYKLRAAQIGPDPLPTYVLVDTRTMKIVSVTANPGPDEMHNRIALELALLDGEPRPAPVMIQRVDGFTEDERDLLRDMKVPSAPPQDPTNEYADVPAAAAFGKTLFSDALLSPSGNVSCATCHVQALDYTDGVAQSTGVAKVDRNSPPIALAAHSRWLFWDGRADTLWGQALGPIEDAKEIGSTRLRVAHQIVDRYAATYATVFGSASPLPVSDIQAMPANGKPGDAAYDSLPAADKDKVTRVFVNVGKAIAAFERTLRVEPNALDRYIDGDTNALNEAQKESLANFFGVGCAQCHWGPRLTDDAFHVIRFGSGRGDGQADRGRSDVLPKLASAEFGARTKWAASPLLARPEPVVSDPNGTMIGAFKTPTLRGLPTSAPYGHGGTIGTLAEVASHYGTRGLPHGDSAAVGTTEQWVPQFDSTVQTKLPAILEVMTGKVVVP